MKQSVRNTDALNSHEYSPFSQFTKQTGWHSIQLAIGKKTCYPQILVQNVLFIVFMAIIT